MTAGTQGTGSALYRYKVDASGVKGVSEIPVVAVSAMGIHVRAEAGLVYFCDQESRIFQMDLQGQNVTTLFDYDGSPSGIDFDADAKKLYWAGKTLKPQKDLARPCPQFPRSLIACPWWRANPTRVSHERQ